MQLSFSIPAINLKLQLFDKNEEICCVKGKSLVTLHGHTLQQSIEDIVPAVVGAPPTPVTTKGDKKDKEAEKREKEEKERILKEQAATLSVRVQLL
jgi:ribosomal protein L12E/L44/L45/RPP1/RPP2